jgi:hypothetical protein
MGGCKKTDEGENASVVVVVDSSQITAKRIAKRRVRVQGQVQVEGNILDSE